MQDELTIEFEDGGLMRLQWLGGKLSVHLQAFHPGGLRKATGTTVLVDEEKTRGIIEWLDGRAAAAAAAEEPDGLDH
jgi:hypothetical protein